MQKLEFGYNCKDIVTGITGILRSRMTYITGCDRIELVIKNGEGKWVDAPTIKILDYGIFKDLQGIEQCNTYGNIDKALYEFGVLAKDKITEYEGKIIGKSIGISGDISYGLSPKFSKESQNNEVVWFDEGRLEIVNENRDDLI
ncbi:hypothetical protein [Clostridium sp.]|uniref:hypothetical protein n=1 Tax=Clostridium sp. TaxID=1506 RepID=UPI002617C337|nr:hypothetical protein [Clostridium sp.]